MRLDQILISEGLVTQEQVAEALEHQKQNGGKLGSLLLRFGHVDESGLLKALERQFGCDSVRLSEIEIPDMVLKFIPSRVARARNVIPFDYNPETNELKIACENPGDEHLVDELGFVARGKTVRLYVAAEMSIQAAIGRCYSSPPEQLLTQRISTPDSAGHSEVAAGTPAGGRKSPSAKGAVLLVTDDLKADDPVRKGLEQENFDVAISDSANEAIGMIGGRSFHTVFVRDSVSGNYMDLIDRVRKISPSTRVRYYGSAGELLLDETVTSEQADLTVMNFDLLTTLLASREKLRSNHSGRVGQYVDRLCRRLELPARDRLAIVTAAYLHDLARYYYGNSDEPNYERTLVTLSAGSLESFNYSPLVTGILRCMYKDLEGKYTKRLPIEALGGNIVTVADIFCEGIPYNEKVSLDRFDRIKQTFHDLVGKLFMAEVVEAFLNMVQEDMLAVQESRRFNQVMILYEDSEAMVLVEQRLRRHGFRTVVVQSIDEFVDLYGRSRPDIQVLIKHGSTWLVSDFVGVLVSRGVAIDSVATFLLVDHPVATELTSMVEKGIEDVIPMDDNLDLLIAKMKKIGSRLELASSQPLLTLQDHGTRGSLEDMNLIDLLQALGPSRKTVRLAVSSEDRELVIFLNRGDIVHAACNDKVGPEAVYEAIVWGTGSWAVEPVDADDLPEQNNHSSNEAILMEGCRLLDERERAARSGAASPT